MIVYLDTSAIVKLLIREPGSELAIDVWSAADTRVTSLLTYAEARAALAAARRDRRLTAGVHTAARGRLGDRWAELERAAVTDEIVRLAGELADREALRGYDAVHLATALVAGEGSEVLVVTWDEALARAAMRSGTSVAPTPA